jgi:hypothetical protein
MPNGVADKRRPRTAMPHKKQLPIIWQTVLIFLCKRGLQVNLLEQQPLTS